MLKSNFRSLLKLVVILVILFVVVDAKSQTSPVYRPFSFEEMARPLILATEAYNKAEEDIEEAFVKAVHEYDKANYELALFYLEKCSRINKRFDFCICNQGTLNSYISNVRQQTENGKKEVKAKGSVLLSNNTAISLRKHRSVNSDEIIKIPPHATIFVLEKVEEEIFMKIRYEGHIGYISKGWLKYK